MSGAAPPTLAGLHPLPVTPQPHMETQEGGVGGLGPAHLTELVDAIAARLGTPAAPRGGGLGSFVLGVLLTLIALAVGGATLLLSHRRWNWLRAVAEAHRQHVAFDDLRDVLKQVGALGRGGRAAIGARRGGAGDWSGGAAARLLAARPLTPPHLPPAEPAVLCVRP